MGIVVLSKSSLSSAYIVISSTITGSSVHGPGVIVIVSIVGLGSDCSTCSCLSSSFSSSPIGEFYVAVVCPSSIVRMSIGVTVGGPNI
jgi:hypothetical protein